MLKKLHAFSYSHPRLSESYVCVNYSLSNKQLRKNENSESNRDVDFDWKIELLLMLFVSSLIWLMQEKKLQIIFCFKTAFHLVSLVYQKHED